MSQDPGQRSNASWIAALRAGGGEEATAAARQLRTYLQSALRRILHGRPGAGEIEDLVQESMAQILANLDSFRGDSAFTTWATAVATRVAFQDLRRRAVRGRPRDEFAAVRHEVEELPSTGTPTADAIVARHQLLGALEDAIAADLTPRQQLAIVAELRGIPTVEIAGRMGTNQNALYKLVHDARKKLRAGLLERGFTAQAIREVLAEAVP